MSTLAYIPLLAAPLQIDTISVITIAVVLVAFFAVIIVNLIINHRVKQTSKHIQEVTDVMQHAMEIGGIFVVRFNMTDRHVSNTHGQLLPPDGMSYDDYVSRIHPEDRREFIDFISSLSQQPKGKGECTYRWNDSTTGDNWRYMRNSAVTEGRMAPCDIVSTLTDETAIVAEQLREQDLGERYRLIFERSVVGLSLYDSKGMLLAANENMRQLFHIQPGRDKYYYNNSLFDRPLFQDLLDRENPEELHFCAKVTIPERGINSYMEIRFTPLLDETGNLQNVSLAINDVTEEREMYIRIKQNEHDMRKANAAIQQYETELQYLMENCDMRVWRTSFRDREVTFYKGLSEYERKMSFDEFKTYFIDTDGSVSSNFDHPELYFTKPTTLLRRMYSLFHEPGSIEWNMLDCMPVYDAQGQLEGSFGTIRNMTALMKTQEQLKEETRRANDSARQKSVFMANMTHEIRTPLNSIVGFSDLLPIIDSPEEKREMVKVIMNNCDMLLRLINDILEVSTMDSNAITLEPEPVDFANVFDDIYFSLEQRIQTSGVEFIKDNPYTTLPAVLDKRRIQQVITNFVTNAVKYTHEGHIKVGYRLSPSPSLQGRGGVTSSEEKSSDKSIYPSPSQGGAGGGSADGLYIYCEDTGTGIPKDKQALVFERFVKLNDYVQGTGLGLAICKAIATRSGGTIGVSSEGEGQGSTFWIWIPVQGN